MPSHETPRLTVKSKAPTRIDLAGGTLDLWPIHHLLPRKATVNFGITLDAEVLAFPSEQFCLKSHDQSLSQVGSFEDIVTRPTLPIISILLEAFWSPALPPLTIETKALSPAGAGLGGSSCLGIAIAGALNQLRHALGRGALVDQVHLIKIVQDAESRLIRAPTGVQDYWGAVRGHLNIIEFPFGSVEVTTLASDVLAQLNDMLIVAYSGQSRASAINNWEIFKGLYDGDQSLLRRFIEIGDLAYQCGQAFKQSNLSLALELSKAEWHIRKSLWPLIETSTTKSIDQAALEHGAFLTRVCGAGGGGVMSIFVAPERRTAVMKAVEKAGAKILNAEVARYGLTVN